jgi:hypothetical protein
MASENMFSFQNIPWEASPEQIISQYGLPDLIYNKSYENNIRRVEIVWINPSTTDIILLEYGENNNIQIGQDINIIFEKYNELALHYENILFAEYFSTMILDVENKMLINNYIRVNIFEENYSEKMDISYRIFQFLHEIYGAPYWGQDESREELTLVTFLWNSNNTQIIFKMQLVQDGINNPENTWRIVNYIYVNYSYIEGK